jgi:hypothetical protein
MYLSPSAVEISWMGSVEWRSQTLAQAASGGLDVCCLEEGGNDHDTVCSGGEDLGKRGGGDAANAKSREMLANFVLHDGDVLESDGRATGLGGSGEKRAEADIVESLDKGGASLVEGVGGAADEERARMGDGRWKKAAGKMRPAFFEGLGEAAVVLADMDAIGADGGGEFREVVEDEWDARSSAEREELAGNALDGGEIVVFCTELENIRTAGEE